MSKPAASADLPPEVVEAFTSSAVTALQELAQLEAIPTNSSAIGTTFAGDAVVAVMRLLRPVPGTMTLVLPTDTARRLSEAYLPAGTELTDEIINDVAGELANVIAGQAKTILKGTPYHFTLSIPVVSRHAGCGQSPGVAITLAVETTLLLLLVDLCPCPGA
jgi:CheY-specific phosphatase CheX